MIDEAQDRLMQELGRLPVLEPDTERSARTRARCRAALARTQPLQAHPAWRVGIAAVVAEPVLVGALCLMYLAAVLQHAFRLHDVR
jgi:hypothetical protein